MEDISKQTCPVCKGLKSTWLDGILVACPTCQGKGIYSESGRGSDGFEECPECEGTGMGRFHHNRKASCDACQGTGKAKRDRPELKFNNVLEADAHNWDTRELDRPDREKIEELIKKAIMDYNQDPNPECAFDYYVPDVADQIIALLPAIEECNQLCCDFIADQARKQEKKEIREMIMDMYDGRFPEAYNEAIRKMWQALEKDNA